MLLPHPFPSALRTFDLKLLAAMLMFWAGVHVAWAAGSPVTLTVLGRSILSDSELHLSPADLKVLGSKKHLRVGTSEPDYPPFDITNHNNEFEGISADYLALIGQLLAVQIQVQRYPSRPEVIQALKRGEIDLLASANGFEAADPDLRLSEPYTLDQPTLVARSNDSPLLDPTLAGKTVAMVDHYLPLNTVQAFYPHATFKLYPSILNAVGAVAFSKADIYLGDSVTASYLINKSYLNNVQLVDFSRMEVNNFSFAATRQNTPLLHLVNAALRAIPSTEQMAIARRWNAGGVSISGTHQVQFSVEEQRWLAQHPRLKVIINEDFLPFTFFDEQQRFRGLSADVIAKISLRTGLKFDPQKGGSVDEMITRVNQGNADLLAALTPSIDRQARVSFSRPYLSTPFVLVTRNRVNSPNSLQDLSGKRLAIIKGNASREMIERQFPQVQIVEAQSLDDAFSLLAKGSVDASVSTLVSARYLISRNYPDQLRISATVGARAAQLAFAVDRSSPILLSILNKALLSISPEEMDELTNRWRSPLVLDDSYWAKHRTAILQGFALAAGLLLSACVWIVLLRRQVLRRKLAERALSARLEFDRVLINGTPHPTYVRDRQARLLLCNNAYRQVFGVEDERQLLGTTVMQSLLSSEEQALEYHRDYLAVMDADEPMLRDRQIVLPSGEVLTIYHWILPFRGSEGRVDGLIGGWVDVSDRQRLVEELHTAKREADNANRAKTTFLATMSHEIRTPMNAVLGMLEMAARKSEQGLFDRAAIDVASGAAKELLALIGDVLDIARIESGRQRLTPESANPFQLLNSVARVFDGLAREKGIALVLDIDPALDRNVLIDAMRFKQIIANLLSNAIKFTSVGEVRITAHAQSANGTHPLQLSVSITDTGVGICEADQQQLFSPFSQAGNQQQGSGLGLVISRSLIELMGGSLALSSVPSKGTRVTLEFELPATDAPSPQAGAPLDIVPGLPLNVLIVDDYTANRLVLSQQLAYLGHAVQEASDGIQALALWNAQPFDVVVTDCDMPGMNGYQLAQAIRQAEHARGEPGCLLLGFTANAVAEEKQRCLQAGMDDCLFKPISLEQLNARLQPLQTEYFIDETGAELTPASLDAQLKTLTLGKSSALQTLREELISSTRADLHQLTELLARDDRQSLAHLAHRVKGGARLIRYEQLILTCEHLEANCTNEAAQMHLSTSVQAVEICMRRLLDLLRGDSRPVSA